MTLQEKIKSDLNIAIFKRKPSADFLKIIVAEMDRKQSKVLSNDEVLKILKMMKEGAIICGNAYEINLLNQYLPRVLSEEETSVIINNIIAANNYSSRDFGKIMKNLDFYGPALDKKFAASYLKTVLT